jgi:hypothetical protein
VAGDCHPSQGRDDGPGLSGTWPVNGPTQAMRRHGPSRIGRAIHQMDLAEFVKHLSRLVAQTSLLTSLRRALPDHDAFSRAPIGG